MVQKIIETKKCTQCGSNFDIFDQDLIFLDKLSPTIAGVKYQLPTPKICPNCRQQNRAVFRNRRNLYKRTCDLTGKSIVSMYSIEKPFKVYYNKDFENKFDATEYGRDIDLSKSILQQFYELCSEVPHYHSAVMTDTMENSEYVNGSHGTKDSYLSFSVTDCEKVFHCEGIYRSYNCIDCYHVHDCELCYECIESSNMFRSMWCEYCVDCSYSNFCFNCENCNNCFLCSNLIGQNYCISNKQYTKEERLDLAPKVINQLQNEGLRGEFFPPDLSPFPYNDTVAMDYFPTKEVKDKNGNILQKRVEEGFGLVTVLEPDKFISDAILDLGGEEKIKIKRRTKDHNINIPSNANIINAKDLPEDINDASDSVCSQIILCHKTGRPYRITKLELEFYRKMQIALPRIHQDIRHKRRTLMRPPRELYYRHSDKSGKETVSNYHKNVPFKVYLQSEYEKIFY